jgi:hypothetical protein
MTGCVKGFLLVLHMSKYFSHYCELISSCSQLDYCRQAKSVGDLLASIKKLWGCEQFGDNELLSEISRLNQTPITSSDVKLAGNWLPYRYQPRRQVVNWLLPVGKATEPFQDETISRYRQQLLLNQLIQPCTTLESAQQQASNIIDVQPAGFIFHLSRCGSTLVSGCISELETTCVFSESPLLTELLLDGNLSAIEQQSCLRSFINLQAAAYPDRPRMIIKWNAWDIFRWDLIRGVFPQVSAIFLVRDPLEIIASHQRSAGRHMSGDPALADFDPIFNCQLADQDLTHRRIHVLQGMLEAMREKCLDSKVMIVAYQQLYPMRLASILAFFGCAPDAPDFLKIQERMQFHSKTPGQLFVADGLGKQQSVSSYVQENSRAQLTPIYNHLLQLAHRPHTEVINVC